MVATLKVNLLELGAKPGILLVCALLLSRGGGVL